MSKGGAMASRDIKQMVAVQNQEREQVRQSTVGIKFKCHELAVNATTKVDRLGDRESFTPADKEIQLEYAQKIYEWVTEDNDGT